AAVTCHCSGKLGRNLTKTSGSLGTISRFREFQGSSTVPQNARVGMRCEGPVPSTRHVMRRFARVVALPDPKIVIFPAESMLSYGWVAGYGRQWVLTSAGTIIAPA